MSINSVVFSGNVAADPRYREAETYNILSFPIAVNNRVRHSGGSYSDEVFYMQCFISGKRAKSLSEIIKHGMPVTVSGILKPSNYQKDGKTVYGYQVKIEEIQLPPKHD